MVATLLLGIGVADGLRTTSTGVEEAGSSMRERGLLLHDRSHRNMNNERYETNRGGRVK